MPEIDGIEATRIIREEIGTEYAKTVPIIALTANAIVGNEDMFLNNGFQDFLSKPIDIIRMNVAINQWVRDKELEKELAKSNKTAQDKPVTPAADERHDVVDRPEPNWQLVPGLDFKKGLARFGDDREIYWDVLVSYATNTPGLLDKAGECTEENLADYAICVHGVKGSSNSIGAETVGAKAEALEHAAKAGDFAFVNANNGKFISMAQKFIEDLNALLQSAEAENPKPKKAEPDADTLGALRDACATFDANGAYEAIEELGRYEYESGAELVGWLKEKVDLMGFKEIHERLSED
jgi:CheY-like chemotaxis protein